MNTNEIISWILKEDIEELKGTIENEIIWEKGYSGNESNPHTENIKIYKECIKILVEELSKFN